MPGGTPGPGPFGPSPAFGHIPDHGVHVVPAQTVPRPGVYSGPSAIAAHHPWVWITLLLVAAVVIAVTAGRFLRRS